MLSYTVPGENITVLLPGGSLVPHPEELEPPDQDDRKKGLKNEAKVLGTIQILSGAMIMSLGVLLLWTSFPHHFRPVIVTLVSSGYPFVGAKCFIISGLLCVILEKRSTKRLAQRLSPSEDETDKDPACLVLPFLKETSRPVNNREEESLLYRRLPSSASTTMSKSSTSAYEFKAKGALRVDLEEFRPLMTVLPLAVFISLWGLVGNGLVLGPLVLSVKWAHFTVVIFHLSLADFIHLSRQTVFLM
ncbi:uncharacterized protein [Equus asinus]|uniref:Uncharacterized protein n=1 Tax=Equus asinus TaxID=9793 RepID=A0A9L0KCS0_EQUAS|nr:uncharacterized protein LOC123277833 [Equus asinus]XP_044605741.1 uncharacterized protein LOC123277833 [Equus asinus]